MLLFVTESSGSQGVIKLQLGHRYKMGIKISKGRKRTTSKVHELYEKPKHSSSSSSGSGSGPEFLTPGARIRSLKIDRQLARDRESQQKVFKILILGTAESGKSTIFKQMRILHTKGFSSVDLYSYRSLIHGNCVDALSQLLWAKRTHKIDSDSKALEDDMNNFQIFIQSVKGKYLLDPTMSVIMQRIWESHAIQEVYRIRWKFQFMDSAAYLLFRKSEVLIASLAGGLEVCGLAIARPPTSADRSRGPPAHLLNWRSKPLTYSIVDLNLRNDLNFLNSLDRITAIDYCPSIQDVLQSRIATSGISEMRFDFREVKLHMVDVGGQKSEQKKWIHCFDNVHVILYIAALSDYDQQILPDDSPRTSSEENKLRYSLDLFQSISGSTYLEKATFVLFLNKKDVFREKIEHNPLQICFSEYKGGNYYYESSQFILQKFSERLPEGKTVYSHLTQATDTKGIDYVFNVCMNKTFKENLSNCGMY